MERRAGVLILTILSALGMLAVLAAGPVRAAAQYAGGSTVRIEGRVYADRGQSIPSARVHLESAEGDEIFSTALTPGGRYEIANLRRGVYRLTATADGYQAFQETIDLTRASSHLIIDIMLSPKATGPAYPRNSCLSNPPDPANQWAQLEGDAAEVAFSPQR